MPAARRQVRVRRCCDVPLCARMPAWRQMRRCGVCVHGAGYAASPAPTGANCPCAWATYCRSRCATSALLCRRVRRCLAGRPRPAGRERTFSDKPPRPAPRFRRLWRPSGSESRPVWVSPRLRLPSTSRAAAAQAPSPVLPVWPPSLPRRRRGSLGTAPSRDRRRRSDGRGARASARQGEEGGGGICARAGGGPLHGAIAGRSATGHNWSALSE